MFFDRFKTLINHKAIDQSSSTHSENAISISNETSNNVLNCNKGFSPCLIDILIFCKGKQPLKFQS